jgi:superfamily I DNA/RNA helicase
MQNLCRDSLALIHRARVFAKREPDSLSRKFRRGQSLDDFTANEITHWVKGAANSDQEDYETFAFPSAKSSLSPQETDWIFDVLAHYERLKGARADEQDVLSAATRDAMTYEARRWSAVLIDEFQDLDLCGLRFVRALCKMPENLFFAGDHRQRIYRTLPSFERAGINIRGRSREVTLNYRNSPEIYAAASAVLSGSGNDPDGVDGDETSVEFAHPASLKPVVCRVSTLQEESNWVCDHIRKLIQQGTPEHHIAVISLHIEQSNGLLWDSDFRLVQMDPEQVNRIAAFAKKYVRRMTIHQSKGFEFPIVFFMGLAQESYENSEIVRFQENGEEVIRALLYVGMTRARDRLYMSTSGQWVRQIAEINSSLIA